MFYISIHHLEGAIEKKNHVFSFSDTAQSLPSPHVFAISPTSCTAWKSQHTLPSLPSLCLSQVYTRLGVLQHIMNFVALFSLLVAPYAWTNESLLLSIYFYFSLCCLPTFPNISAFYPSACLPHSPHTGSWYKYLEGPPVSCTAAASCGLK